MDMGAAIRMTTAGAATAVPAAMYAAIASGSAAAGRSVQAASSTPTLHQAMLQPPARAARLPMTMYLHFSLTDYFLIESLQLTSPKGVQLQLCTVPNEQQQFSSESFVEQKCDN